MCVLRPAVEAKFVVAAVGSGGNVEWALGYRKKA